MGLHPIFKGRVKQTQGDAEQPLLSNEVQDVNDLEMKTEKLPPINRTVKRRKYE